MGNRARLLERGPLLIDAVSELFLIELDEGPQRESPQKAADTTSKNGDGGATPGGYHKEM